MAKKKKRDIGKIATRVIAAILALMFVISIVATLIYQLVGQNTKDRRDSLENYFTININNILNSIVEYFIYLKENPWRLIVLILDLAIVSGLIYKFIKYSKTLIL